MDEQNTQLRLLALGGKRAYAAAHSLEFTDAKIDTMDTAPERGVYDIILSFHHLQTIPVKDIRDEIEKMKFRMKEDGEMHIFVPSLEWAARQVLSKTPNPLWRQHLFGKQNKRSNFNKNGFRLIDLRHLLAEEFAITHAAPGEYVDTINDKEYAAGQFYIRGEHK